MADYTLTDKESALLGQEFLTWLWFRSEMDNGLFATPDGHNFTVFMDQRVQVQGGEGDEKETAVVTGAHARMAEAKMGLRRGKKVGKAQLKFDQDGEEWTVQVKAEDFALGSMKPPKVEKTSDDDPDAVFLEKLFLIENCLTFLDTLYTRFLDLRLSPNKWEEEVSSFRHWLAKEE
ncbi:hypothetical protein [Desulfohalovibrio reitneri]|jgi:hypothetical protein|uniref:hypothetical protein n=1 Tax=Desulfohalovibrio reitneri TaxID=1307759 RepID=UPI0004A6EE5F|nr:hypothetical protein [Desulfohalovibrio reitneri]